ncbi:glycosyltransferase [Pseudomonas sp. ANT_J12]|uniref:glycosyltransferase family 2 protein n=1 Tax=Pseudomonas sp. ANT_J12 TaxID=2597351 RepID=UPI0011F3C998|nr:glycosyltransferase [Pseudomonas sp. ANT_J12]KAA0987721.1 glycosyltransferase [Pseudomonas sp. ANT_J12]
MNIYNPKVSVMIITYNQSHLIAETIESVLLQDYKNLEIVVADDASTDGTREVILDFQRRYPDVVIPILNEKNMGITGNSNAAFFACTGELVAILGGDDLFLPGKIKAQVEQFEDSKVVLSYHPVDIFNHADGKVLFRTNTTEKEKINNVYDLISKGGIPGASSVMVRRSACPSHGFDPLFPVVSDWIFYIEVALRGEIRELSGVFGKYRKHGLGASDRTFELLQESLLTVDLISQRYASDPAIQKACEQGGYRYLLGELFRQIVKKNKANVEALHPLFLKYSSGSKKCLTNIVFKVLNNSIIFNLVSGLLPKLKNAIKRNV